MKIIKIAIFPNSVSYGKVLESVIFSHIDPRDKVFHIHKIDKNMNLNELPNFDIAFIDQNFGNCSNQGIAIAKYLAETSPGTIRISYSDRGDLSPEHFQLSTHIERRSFLEPAKQLYLKDLGWSSIMTTTSTALKEVEHREKLNDSATENQNLA